LVVLDHSVGKFYGEARRFSRRRFPNPEKTVSA
jgi:hypothetical protein